MVNLYQILGLSPTADHASIYTALQVNQGNLPPKVVQAIHQYLLNPEMRIRYDEKLRLDNPEFFQSISPPPMSLQKPANNFYQPNTPPPLPTPNPTFNPYQTPQSMLEPTSYPQHQQVEAIYNPNASALWSILFTPFGAYLHAKNWEILGNEDLARQNMVFFWVILSAIIGLTILEMLFGISVPNVAISIVPLIIWYTQLGKKQIAYVKEHFGNDYERQSLVKPVLIGIVGGMVALFILFTILTMLFSAFDLLHPKWLES